MSGYAILSMAKKKIRPYDVNVIASQIVSEATQEAMEEKPNKKKNPAAVELGRLGGLKGGKARARKLSAERRKKIAQKAAQTRWNKKN